MKRILVLALFVAPIFMIGCTSWERTTFQTLATSQAVIQQAEADYQTGVLIKPTKSSYDAIQAAAAAQHAAVDLMVTYENIKAAGGNLNGVTADQVQAQVTVLLASLPADINAVKAAYITAKGGK